MQEESGSNPLMKGRHYSRGRMATGGQQLRPPWIMRYKVLTSDVPQGSSIMLFSNPAITGQGLSSAV